MDWPHAIDLCEEAVKADANNARLRYLLGNAYFTTKNYLLALRHLEVAADAGYPDAEDELGVMFVRGLGVIKDYQRAFDLFNKAAANGSPTGMGNLGSMYASGFFVKEDDTQALAWYEKSIEAGNAFGLAQAGVLSFNGKGAPRDYQMAAGYFQQAADLGDGYSLKFLAIMYERGLLGKPDPAKAAELRLKAAEVDPDSQNPECRRRPSRAARTAQAAAMAAERGVRASDTSVRAAAPGTATSVTRTAWLAYGAIPTPTGKGTPARSSGPRLGTTFRSRYRAAGRSVRRADPFFSSRRGLISAAPAPHWGASVPEGGFAPDLAARICA